MLSVRSAKRFILCLCALLFLSACSFESFISPPEISFSRRNCNANPAYSIFLVSLGWHTGVLLRTVDVENPVLREIREFKRFPYVEIGWGERKFYMGEDYSWYGAIRAALFSSDSVLHIAGFSDPKRFIKSSAAVELGISHCGMRKLARFILESLLLDKTGNPRLIGASLYGEGHFYEATRSFSLGYTCNSWTSAALKQAKCPLESTYQRASSLMNAVMDFPDLSAGLSEPKQDKLQAQ